MCETLFGQIHPKCWYQLAGNFHVYLHAKNKIHQFFFKILQKYYQIPILGTLDMPDQFHQKR